MSGAEPLLVAELAGPELLASLAPEAAAAALPAGGMAATGGMLGTGASAFGGAGALSGLGLEGAGLGMEGALSGIASLSSAHLAPCLGPSAIGSYGPFIVKLVLRCRTVHDGRPGRDDGKT